MSAVSFVCSRLSDAKLHWQQQQQPKKKSINKVLQTLDTRVAKEGKKIHGTGGGLFAYHIAKERSFTAKRLDNTDS